MLFDNAINFTLLPESDKDLKTLLNYNTQHSEYTRKQNIPERNPNETDRGGWRGYDRVYTKYLSDKRDKVINLLEIGVYFGYGLLTWSRYFKNANIYGIDIFLPPDRIMEINKIKNDFKEYSRVKLSLADSTKEDMWLLFDENQFEIIIDDGGHHPLTQIKTLEYGWKYLKPGGTYFIEDVSHRYGEEYIVLLNDKLLKLSKENYISIYSHKNRGLKYLNNKEWLKRNKIVNLENPTEYIVVIQKL